MPRRLSAEQAAFFSKNIHWYTDNEPRNDEGPYPELTEAVEISDEKKGKKTFFELLSHFERHNGRKSFFSHTAVVTTEYQGNTVPAHEVRIHAANAPIAIAGELSDQCVIVDFPQHLSSVVSAYYDHQGQFRELNFDMIAPYVDNGMGWQSPDELPFCSISLGGEGNQLQVSLYSDRDTQNEVVFTDTLPFALLEKPQKLFEFRDGPYKGLSLECKVEGNMLVVSVVCQNALEKVMQFPLTIADFELTGMQQGKRESFLALPREDFQTYYFWGNEEVPNHVGIEERG